MPYKEKDIEKKYYSISEVANKLNVTVSLIRFWEKEFSTIRPKKTSKGSRKFTKDDFKSIKLVYHLVKVKGYTLQGARNFIANNNVDVSSNKIDMIASLKEIRKFLVELKQEVS